MSSTSCANLILCQSVEFMSTIHSLNCGFRNFALCHLQILPGLQATSAASQAGIFLSQEQLMLVPLMAELSNRSNGLKAAFLVL